MRYLIDSGDISLKSIMVHLWHVRIDLWVLIPVRAGLSFKFHEFGGILRLKMRCASLVFRTCSGPPAILVHTLVIPLGLSSMSCTCPPPCSCYYSNQVIGLHLLLVKHGLTNLWSKWQLWHADDCVSELCNWNIAPVLDKLITSKMSSAEQGKTFLQGYGFTNIEQFLIPLWPVTSVNGLSDSRIEM